jgi:spore coat polysaccharide biosynthesis protein SpsF
VNKGSLAVFITVRTGSTRLPGKALLPVDGKPALQYLLDHIRQSRLTEQFVLCTTTRPADDVLVRFAEENRILHFRGSEPDKLARWHGAAQAHDVQFFVTADGDDLLADPLLIDEAFQRYQSSGCDFIQGEGFPCGAFTYGISSKALAKACQIKATDDTEMMWGYFLDTGLFRVETLVAPPELRRPEIRMTLDYPEDLTFFEAVIQALAPRRPFVLRDIVAWLDHHPEVVKINQFRQEEFMLNQQRRKKTLLRMP